MVWATRGGYSWSETATAARLSPRTNTCTMYSASFTDCRDPTAVRSTSTCNVPVRLVLQKRVEVARVRVVTITLEVKVMKSCAVPRWKKLMLERSKPVWGKQVGCHAFLAIPHLY